MKPFEWDTGKNTLLRNLRGLDFNNIIKALGGDGLIDTVPHTNQKKYPGQKMYIVKIDNYCCVVPFIETQEKIFLKTVYFSRQATKKYLKQENNL